MSISCTPQEEISLAVPHNRERSFSNHFLVGLVISALIWAALVAGMVVSASVSPAAEQPQLSLSR